MKIRLYRQSDRKTFITMMEDFQDHLITLDKMKLRIRKPGYGLRYVAQLLADVRKRKGIILVAEEGKAIVGFVVGVMETQTKDQLLEFVKLRTGRVLELYVADGYRGKRVGTKLLESIEAHFRKEGCDVVRLEVLSFNEQAYDFYKKREYNDRFVEMIKRMGK